VRNLIATLENIAEVDRDIREGRIAEIHAAHTVGRGEMSVDRVIDLSSRTKAAESIGLALFDPGVDAISLTVSP